MVTATPTRRAPHNVLVNLPPPQVVQLVSWLIKDNLTYHAAAAKLAEVFAVTVSHETVHQFFKRYCAPEMHRRDEFIRRTVQKLWKEKLTDEAEASTPPK